MRWDHAHRKRSADPQQRGQDVCQSSSRRYVTKSRAYTDSSELSVHVSLVPAEVVNVKSDLTEFPTLLETASEQRELITTPRLPRIPSLSPASTITQHKIST